MPEGDRAASAATRGTAQPGYLTDSDPGDEDTTTPPIQGSRQVGSAWVAWKAFPLAILSDEQ